MSGLLINMPRGKWLNYFQTSGDPDQMPHLIWVWTVCIAPDNRGGGGGGTSNEYPQHMFCGEIRKLSVLFGSKKGPYLGLWFGNYPFWVSRLKWVKQAGTVYMSGFLSVPLSGNICDHPSIQVCSIYQIYPKFSDNSTPYRTCTCSKIWTSAIYYLMLCLKIAGWVANNVYPDESPSSAASHLGLHYLLRPVCLNT